MQGQLWNAAYVITVSSTDVRPSSMSAIFTGISTVLSFPDKCVFSSSSWVRWALHESGYLLHVTCLDEDAGVVTKYYVRQWMLLVW